MTSYSPKRSSDFVRAYRSMLSDITRPRITPRVPSNSRVYNPASLVSTSEASTVFFPLFYAGEKGALGIWDKRAGVGIVKRRLDDEDRSYHVLELANPKTNLGTFICTPKSALNALHITLPHLIIAMKNYRRNFAFDVLIMDSNAYRRRFSFATWYNPSSLKKFSFMCQIPLRLEIGWNEIHVDFNELVRNTYRTQYVETIRVQIYANCKLRQVFFCDDKVMNGDIPIPSMRDFENIRMVPLDYGPRTHPDAIEHGPERKREIPYVDPPLQIPSSRLEMDLRYLQQRRFNEVSKQRLMLQPYKTYFRELLNEQKLRKRVAAAAKDVVTGLPMDSSTVETEAVSKSESTNDGPTDKEQVPTLADVVNLLQDKKPMKLVFEATSKEAKEVVIKPMTPPPPTTVILRSVALQKSETPGSSKAGQTSRNNASTSTGNSSNSSNASVGPNGILKKSTDEHNTRMYSQRLLKNRWKPVSPKQLRF